MLPPLLCLVFVLFLFLRETTADYVDPSFNCPATTTCVTVCVASLDDCPTAMVCDDDMMLCKDGTCAGICDADLETPCEFECASIACPKVIDTYDQCKAKYGAWYDEEAKCGEIETDEETDKLQYNEPGFIAVYVILSVVTAMILLWCAYNQKIAPVPSQALTVEGQGEETYGLQIGYRFHVLGEILHVLTLLTFAGWVVILAFLTIQYYALDGNQYVDGVKVFFEDEEQLLKTFIVAWSAGFVWCFTLKWPFTIQSLFLRRCQLKASTHVAVYVKRSASSDRTLAGLTNKESRCFGFEFFKDLFDRVFGYVQAIMSFIFSDRDCFHLSDDGIYQICRVEKGSDGTRFFVFLFRRYNFDDETGLFKPGRWVVGESLQDLQAAADTDMGLSIQDVQARYRVVGLNTIEMEKPSYLSAVRREFSKPFYTYQLFMIWSWFPLYYYYMALVWTVVVLTSGLSVSYFHFRNLRTLFAITNVWGDSQVLRDGKFVTMDQKYLVPGDVVKIQPGITFCDMVLTSGGATLVDESALTGETTPQAKTPINKIESELAKVNYNRTVHKRHTISAGTTILESDGGVGIVLQTGSFTAKGELLRDIISFNRHKFKFDSEIPIVIGILFLYAIFAFNMTVYFIEDKAVYGWFYGMYVVATILPPLLPTVFTVSVGVSDERLSLKRIATVNSESILIAGKVDRAFFDKTGTLTKQGLDFLGTRSSTTWDSPSDTMSEYLSLAMATCHALTLSHGGEVVGSPVDRNMFTVSGANLEMPENAGSTTSITSSKGEKLVVVRHFDFDHHRMSQSVIVQLPDSSLLAFVKGSGEKIQKMCLEESLPADFESELHESAKNGIYQISVATKVIKADSVSTVVRDEVESDLNFVGVINFKNVMRDDTPSVIAELSDGGVQSVMLTGDSVLAGIRVAKESGIMDPEKPVFVAGANGLGEVTWNDFEGNSVDMPSLDELHAGSVELAISGKAWEIMLTDDPKTAASLAHYARVFGRLTPHDKVSVVELFNHLGSVTLMCGDGGNDVGALKAAHVGVALSEAEASIVAPFTSLDKTITSVVDVLKEGRCALASALATYKFMIMYGQIETMIQLISAYFQVTVTEWCWVFMDGIWTITLAFTLPLARPADKLAASRPTASILGPQTLMSALGVLMINYIFAIIALSVLFHQDWFQCRKWDDNDVSNVLVIGDNYESQVLFLVMGYQYISSAIAFNFGYEFRQAWCRNYLFVFLAALYTFLMFYITLVPGELSCIWRVNCVNEDTCRGVTSHEPLPIQNPFNSTVMPKDFRVTILMLMIFNAVATSGYEFFIVNGIRHRYAAAKRCGNYGKKKQIQEDTDATLQYHAGV